MTLTIIQSYAGATCIALWGLITWADWMHQKIKHRYLLYGLILGLVGYAAVLANTLLGIWGFVAIFHSWGFYKVLLVHLALSAGAALALWQLRVWPAGDAKLLMLLSLLYPLVNLTGSFPWDRLFLAALINTFLSACAYVFAQAVAYAWRVHLRHIRAFLAELGWRREAAFYRQSFLEALRQGATAAVERWRDIRRAWEAFRSGLSKLASAPVPGPDLSKAAAFLHRLDLGRFATRQNALQTFLALLQWLSSLMIMTVVSYHLRHAVGSSFVLSLVCFGIFFVWAQYTRMVGNLLSWLTLGLIVFGMVRWGPGLRWDQFLSTLKDVSVFSLFMFFGMRWTQKMLDGRIAFILPLLSPLIFPPLGWLAGLLWSAATWPLVQAWGAAAWLGARVLSAASALAHGARPLFQDPGPAGPAPLAPQLVVPAALRPLLDKAASALNNLPSLHSLTAPLQFVMPDFPWHLAPWAFMGVFFGFSLVIVRKWDAEVHPGVSPEALRPFMVLSPIFVERLRTDPEFYEEHFSSVYADGITPEQTQALKAWCAENAVGLVPLAPTMSFAFWLFFGFFLTRLLGGGHVVEALRWL